MDWASVWSLVDKGGVVALLVIILLGGVRRWWVFGWTYREEVERGKEWRELALTGTRIAEHVASRRSGRRSADDT